jgi:hypothetical protein
MNRKPKSALSRSHEEATVGSFRDDPAFAADASMGLIVIG